jgi:hypothetical protein
MNVVPIGGGIGVDKLYDGNANVSTKEAKEADRRM